MSPSTRTLKASPLVWPSRRWAAPQHPPAHCGRPQFGARGQHRCVACARKWHDASGRQWLGVRLQHCGQHRG
eukprot:9865471-Alexandrium_andersonii.AAC.1